jgi:hypothetical protein
VALKTVGLANGAAATASILSVDTGNVDLLVEALKTTTDAKTLANPKVAVANGQEARIQIGKKLGYLVTTTTQTSTLQSVDFLNTGILLRVTPQISSDDRVLLFVRPEVSDGDIVGGLPQSNTTEAETTVLMKNGEGMVIGGLINEKNLDVQTKVPILGDLWLVGRLFQRRTLSRQRSEIIIVLIPHIAPYEPGRAQAEQDTVMQTTAPIFGPGLIPHERPWEDRLPDAMNNPRRFAPRRLGALLASPYRRDPKPPRHFFPTRDERAFDALRSRAGTQPAFSRYADPAPNAVVEPLPAGIPPAPGVSGDEWLPGDPRLPPLPPDPPAGE